MKRSAYWYLLAALVILPALYFTACSEKAELNTPAQSNQTNLDSPQFALIDYKDVQNGLEDATLDTDMGFNSTLVNYTFLNMASMTSSSMMGGNPWIQKFDQAKMIGLILKALNVTDAQKIQLSGFTKTFHDTMKPLVKSYVAANDSILKAASVQRKAIAADYKSGNITKLQADAQLKTLNQATRDAVNANPQSKAIKIKMCAARDLLFSSIQSILTADQLTKWNTFIVLIKNPCI